MLLGVVHSTQQFRYIPADQIGVGDVTSVFVRVTLVISYFSNCDSFAGGRLFPKGNIA